MASTEIPATQKQIVVKKLGVNFRDVTRIEEGPVPSPEKEQILVKNKYVGINASDINFTNGRYFDLQLPCAAGMEALGEVVRVGENSKFKVGQYVAYMNPGAFAEYTVAADAVSAHVPSLEAEQLAMFASGLAAAVALDKEADLKAGKTVLVTAAAGGAGQFAVQIAKLAGCHVIGTCSTERKVAFLSQLGCDRVVNYTKENLNLVLSSEYPQGIDVVFECVGKELFDAALKNLARLGRIVVIGQISCYPENEDKNTFEELKFESEVSIPLTLLVKSASLRGMILTDYFGEIQRYVDTLVGLREQGMIKAFADRGEDAPSGPFVGLEKIVDAVEYLYSRKSVGKVMVEL